MNIGKTVFYSFDEVVDDVGGLEESDLLGWMKVIAKYYLTEQDAVVLDALQAKQEGRKQRELSILFCMSQPFLSVKFKHIRTKILTLYNFLKCEDMLQEYLRCRKHLTERQYSLLRLALAGNWFHEIAWVEKVSAPDVSITFKTVVRRLEEAGEYPYLLKFLKKYKGKFIKN
jgi:transcriptional regulator